MGLESKFLAALLPFVDALHRDWTHLLGYITLVFAVAFTSNRLIYAAATLVLCLPFVADLRIRSKRGKMGFPWPAWHLIMAGKLNRPVIPYLEKLWDYLMKNTTRGDPDSIIEAFDKFCWETPTMNVGDVKGSLVDKVLAECKPMVAAEFGAHLGYSTVRMANLLPKGGTIYSIDPSPFSDPFRRALVSYAGLSDRVEFEYDYSDKWMRRKAAEGLKVDFLFIDHVKDIYLSDLLIALEVGIFAPGATIVADNVLTPGCPDYRAYMMEGEGSKLFSTTVHRTLLEYHPTLADEVLVSVLK